MFNFFLNIITCIIKLAKELGEQIEEKDLYWKYNKMF